MRAKQVTSILAASGTLLGGYLVAIGGAELGALGTSAFLIAAPATAVAVSLNRMDPLARIVLALATAVVVNTVVAELMLVTGRWSISGGVVAVAVISAGMWLVTFATTRRKVIAGAEDTDGD